MFAPFGAWIIATLVGVIAGKLITDGLERAWNKEMETDVMSHPVIVEMTKKGWTPITAKSRTKLLFSKSRLAKGLGTADSEQTRGVNLWPPDAGALYIGSASRGAESV